MEKLVLEKVKAHVGVAGNELADTLANEFREKAQWGSNHDWTYCVADSFAKASLKDSWKRKFKEAAVKYTGQSQFRRFITEPTRKFVDVFKKMYRSDVHLVMSLLTDRLRLNPYEVKFTGNQNKLDANCSYCGVPETTEHFLFECQAYKEQRKQLIKDLAENWEDFEAEKTLKRENTDFWLHKKSA